MRSDLRGGITLPSCSEISPAEIPSADGHLLLILKLLLLALGLLGNGIILLIQCGRAKLSSTCFTYLRIMIVLQLIFFLLPFPLKILWDNYQRGQTWVSANMFPVLLADCHFAIVSLVLCLAFRLQIIVSNVRRSRRWNSSGWIAWRKVCWIAPFGGFHNCCDNCGAQLYMRTLQYIGVHVSLTISAFDNMGTIVNVALCFEYQLHIDYCSFGNMTVALGTARLSETAKNDQLKLDLIRSVPTSIFWITVILTILFALQQRCALPRLSSPFCAKHLPLLTSLKCLLVATVLCQAIIHIPNTYFLIVERTSMDESTTLLLYAACYSASPVVMLILSEGLRNHAWFILRLFLTTRKERENGVTKRQTTLPRYSKLEMENSEADDQLYSIRHGLRSILRQDLHRVRFASTAMVPGVPAIEEEDEFDRPFGTSRSDILNLVDGVDSRRQSQQNMQSVTPGMTPAHSVDIIYPFSPAMALDFESKNTHNYEHNSVATTVSNGTNNHSNEHHDRATAENFTVIPCKPDSKATVPIKITISLDPDSCNGVVQELGSAKNDQLL